MSGLLVQRSVFLGKYPLGLVMVVSGGRRSRRTGLEHDAAQQHWYVLKFGQRLLEFDSLSPAQRGKVDRCRRLTALRNVVTLLSQQQGQTQGMSLLHRGEVAVIAESEGRQAFEALPCRSLGDVVTNSQSTGGRSDREQDVHLDVEPPVTGFQAAEQRQRAVNRSQTLAEQFGEGGIPAPLCVGVVEQRVPERQSSMDRGGVKENVDIEKVLLPGLPEPAIDPTVPGVDRPSPFGVLRHHPTGAVGNAGSVQDLGGARAKFGEPGVLRSVRFTRLEEDRVVLIGD